MKYEPSLFLWVMTVVAMNNIIIKKQIGSAIFSPSPVPENKYANIYVIQPVTIVPNSIEAGKTMMKDGADNS